MTPRELWARVAGAFGRGRRDEDLAADLAFHRERLVEEHLRRGLDPVAARRAAHLALGGEQQTLEAWRDQRSLPFVDALRQDARYGLRMLRRAPGFTTAAVLTLAIGIGANTAMFSIVNAVLLRPLPYANPDRLMAVGERADDGGTERVGYTTVVDWQARSRSFESFAVMRAWQPILTVNGEAEPVPGVRVSWNYFDMMGVRPALGRSFTKEEDTPNSRYEVILSDALWRRGFGADPSVIGRTVTLSDVPFRVVGVMPPSFKPLDAALYYAPAEMWAPVGYAVGVGDSCRDCRHLRALGRLRAGVTPAQAAADMSAVQAQLRREHPTEYQANSVVVMPLRRALTGDVRSALWLLAGAVAFVLVIACANVANLLLVRAQVRQRELALRVVLGAGGRRIARQLLTESGLLSVAGGAAGLLLAALGTRGIAALAPTTLPRLDEAGLDGRVLAFTLLTVAATAILVGVGPAVRAARGSIRQQLATDARTMAGGPGRLRAVLVVADLAIALTLLAGAGLMLRSVASLGRVDPGFDAGRVLAMPFMLGGNAYADDSAVVAFQDRAIERLRSLPGVEAVALADQVPFGGDFDCRGFHVQGRLKANPEEDPCIQRYGVTPDYQRVLDIPLLRGRFFSSADTAASQPVVVISASAARLVWGDDNPIGSQLRLGSVKHGPWYTVIGVVGDVRHEDLTAPPIPAVYNAETQFTDSDLVALIKSRSADATTLAPAARDVLHDLDATIPVRKISTLESLIAGTVDDRRFVMRLLAGFAGVALLLAGIGLYGVVSYGVAQRTREVGVRVALGATRSDVLRLILSSGAVLVSLGLAVGVAAAVGTTRLLGSLVFGVSPLDAPTFAMAGAVLVAVAAAAHLIPARRALRVDPAVALRDS